jgi:hypothetical protein
VARPDVLGLALPDLLPADDRHQHPPEVVAVAMSERAFIVVCIYMAVSFGFGIIIGKYLKWRNRGQ